MIKLDKYWEITNMKCPICNCNLYYDTNEDKEATHFCFNCKEGFLICRNWKVRGIKIKNNILKTLRSQEDTKGCTDPISQPSSISKLDKSERLQLISEVESITSYEREDDDI